MAIENFLTYTEKDDFNKLTVTASKALGEDVDDDEDVYLYKDKTADHFDALDEEFEFYVASTSQVNSYGGIAIANTVGSMIAFASTDISALISRTTPAYRIYLFRGNNVALDFYDISADTLYYCTLERVAGNDSASLKVYSDSARTNLLTTLSVAGFGTVKWRYAYGFVSRKTGTADRNFDGYVQNLDLKEVVVVGRSFGYIIG